MVSGVPKTTWQSIIGAALISHTKLGRFAETSKVLRLASSHRSSLQVISAAADFLDSVYG